MEGVRNNFYLFIGGAMKSCCIEHGFGERWRVVFMCEINVLFLPFIKLVKALCKHGHIFYKCIKLEVWVPVQPLDSQKSCVADCGRGLRKILKKYFWKTYLVKPLSFMIKPSVQMSGNRYLLSIHLCVWYWGYSGEPHIVPDFGLTEKTECKWLHMC